MTHSSHPHPHPHMIPGEDACGFCSMEVCRTSLGFAGARDPCRWVSGDAALDRYRHVAVSLVRHCLLHRRQRTEVTAGGVIAVLLERLNDLSQLQQDLAERTKTA